MWFGGDVCEWNDDLCLGGMLGVLMVKIIGWVVFDGVEVKYVLVEVFVRDVDKYLVVDVVLVYYLVLMLDFDVLMCYGWCVIVFGVVGENELVLYR